MKRPVCVALALLMLFAALSAVAGPAPGSYAGDVTGAIFLEAQDQYLSTTDFGMLESSVLFLQFDVPSPIMGSNRFEIGSGLWLAPTLLVSGFYGGANYNNEDVRAGNDTSIVVSGDSWAVAGKIETINTAIQNNFYNSNEGRALLGLKLGAMELGVSYQIVQYANSTSGTYDADTSTISLGSVTTTYDPAGAELSRTSLVYAPGYSKNCYLTNVLQGGLRLPLGSAALVAQLEFSLTPYNYDFFAAEESFSTQVQTGYPQYTAPAAAVFEAAATPTTLNEALSYTFKNTYTDNSYLNLSPYVHAAVELPLAFLPYGAVLTTGVGYDLLMRAYNASYMDRAGAAQSVKGTASYGYSATYSTSDANTDGFIETARQEMRWFDTEQRTYIRHWVAPDLKLVFVPSDKFRFGVAASPQLYILNEGTVSAYEEGYTRTYEDGDGADGNATAGTDPDDYVETYVETHIGSTVNTTTFWLTGMVQTGAQFFLGERFRVNAGATLSNEILDRVTTGQTVSGQTEMTTSRAYNGGTPYVTSYSVDTDLLVADDGDATWETGDFDEYSRVNGTGSLSVSYELGFTFFFSPAMYLDAKFQGTATPSNIFDAKQYSVEMTVLFPPKKS